mgnify:CR=1 FL=1
MGDPSDSWSTRYGAHTMVHGKEDKGTIGRISYTEFKYVG